MSETSELDAEELPDDDVAPSDTGSISKLFDAVSGPIVLQSKDCTISPNIIEFHHSFGYDCKRYYNLCVADESTVIFASGNLVHIFNTVTRELWFRSCAGGGGVGFIAKNPIEPQLAIGETGPNPLIILYGWPSLQIVSILKNGATRSYTHLDYSPDGNLLCSQSGDPDFMLTIWDWRKSEIILQIQASNSRMLNMLFSPFVDGHLASSGVEKIVFWKIVKTYTGLKLIGEHGRFGKTEKCDILGILPMEDEKVISGCSWGNILVWELGVIKLEVTRRNGEPCHNAPITHIDFNNGQLTTVGMDGFVKFWNYRAIEFANPPNDEQILQVEPMYEFEIGSARNPAQLMSVIRRRPRAKHWFAQDGNGGIWNLHLELRIGSDKPEQLLYCHAGPVMEIAPSPCGNYLATIGRDGRVYFYDYIDKVVMVQKQFPFGGLTIIWLPLEVEDSGNVLIAGFEDGVIRLFEIILCEDDTIGPCKRAVTLLQVFKPHNRPITQLRLNPNGKQIVSGSNDATVFLHSISLKDGNISLVPLGFVRVSSAVTFLSWNPKRPQTLMVCCDNGTLSEIELPKEIVTGSALSHELTDVQMRTLRFQSYVLAAGDTKERDTEGSLEQDVQIETCTSCLKPNHQSSEESSILTAIYGPHGTIWLSVDSCGGVLYEYDITTGEQISCLKIDEDEHSQIQSYIFSDDQQYLIFGLRNGQMRIYRVDSDKLLQIDDYLSLPIHDKSNGIIRCLRFNRHGDYLFSCGDDGNIFCYRFHQETSDSATKSTVPRHRRPQRESVRDIFDEAALSLEEIKVAEEIGRREREKKERINHVKSTLIYLRDSFSKLMARNQTLPPSQIIPRETFEIDPRGTSDLSQLLDSEMNSIKSKILFMVTRSDLALRKVRDYFLHELNCVTITLLAISNDDHHVSTFRQRELGSDFFKTKNAIQSRIEDLVRKDLELEEIEYQDKVRKLSKQPSVVIEKSILPKAQFLVGLDKTAPEFKKNIKLQVVLDHNTERKNVYQRRNDEWFEMKRLKPNPLAIHPKDLEAIEIAKTTIGEYKLKSADDFCVPRSLQMTTLKKYRQILETKEIIFQLKDEFNTKVRTLRGKKAALVDEIKELHVLLESVHNEMSVKMIQIPHAIPTIHRLTEFPELDNEIWIEQPNTEGNKYGLITLAEEYEVLLKGFTFKASIKNNKADQSEHDMLSTSWEEERKQMHSKEVLFRQDQICCEMKEKINAFDKEVKILSDLQITLQVKSKCFELFVLKLNQEFIILKSFEEREEVLKKNVTTHFYECHDMRCRIYELSKKINQRNKELRRLGERKRDILGEFADSIAENKFASFLRKIYKMKYQVPTQTEDDKDSDAESFSSEDTSVNNASDPESTSSLEDTHVDESECPDGCEPELFQRTFALRSQRHSLEIKMFEEKRLNENLRRDVGSSQKKLNVLENALNESRLKMEIFQREKQQALNQVDVLVILKIKQVCNFSRHETLSLLNDSLVFSDYELKNLHSRIFELRKESNLEKQKHKQNRLLLHQMRVDCNLMKVEIKQLKQNIVDCKMRKFGTKINLLEVEETLLRKMITEMHLSINDFRKRQEKEFEKLQVKLRRSEEALCRVFRENTKKNKLRAMLQKANNELAIRLHKQETKMQSTKYPEELLEISHEKDVKQLMKVKHQQSIQMKAIQEEIRMLSSKTSRRSLPPNIATSQMDQEHILAAICRSEENALLSSAEDIECISELENDMNSEDSYDDSNAEQSVDFETISASMVVQKATMETLEPMGVCQILNTQDLLFDHEEGWRGMVTDDNQYEEETCNNDNVPESSVLTSVESFCCWEINEIRNRNISSSELEDVKQIILGIVQKVGREMLPSIEENTKMILNEVVKATASRFSASQINTVNFADIFHQMLDDEFTSDTMVEFSEVIKIIATILNDGKDGIEICSADEDIEDKVSEQKALKNVKFE